MYCLQRKVPWAMTLDQQNVRPIECSKFKRVVLQIADFTTDFIENKHFKQLAKHPLFLRSWPL